MVEEKDEFSRLENKFKLSLLQVEKRFVDLETTVSELVEKLKEVDLSSLEDIKQRVEDLEDLIMVEQAGIIELKKLLEEKKPVSPELEEEIKKLQASISDIVSKSELQTQLANIRNELLSISAKPAPSSIEMELLHDKLSKVEGELVLLKSQAERVSRELYEKVKELATKVTEIKPTIDFDLFQSKIESLRISVDDMLKKKIEWELKLAEIEKKFDILENRIRESLSEKILDEIKLNEQNIIATNVRIDFIERVYKDLIKNVQGIENSLKKFESLERFSLLSKEIEEKIDRFKFIEDETRRLSSRVETIYANIDERLEKVSQLDKKFSQISESLSRLAQDVDKVRIALMSSASKEDVNKRISEFEKKFLPEIKIVEVKRFGEDLIKRMEEAKREMDRRIKELENVAKAPTQDLEKRIDILNSKIKDVQNALLVRIDEVKGLVEKRIATLTVPSPLATEQITELFEKLVFLETRLSAIEKVMLEVPRSVPIIIE